VDLELPVPAKLEELERGFEEAEDDEEEPDGEPVVLVERPTCDPRLSLTWWKEFLMSNVLAGLSLDLAYLRAA
jgi:hypothetical protein